MDRAGRHPAGRAPEGTARPRRARRPGRRAAADRRDAPWHLGGRHLLRPGPPSAHPAGRAARRRCHRGALERLGGHRLRARPHGSPTRHRENSIALVRPTSGGRTLVTDPLGRTLAQMEHHADEGYALVARVPTKAVPTLYAAIGDVFAWACGLAVAGLDAVRHITADDKLVFVHLADTKYRTDFTLDELERRLDDRFVRPHRAHIVNLDVVHELIPWSSGTYRLRLKDGTELPVARRRAQKVKATLGR